MVLNIINIYQNIISIKIKGSNINTRFVDCVATCDAIPWELKDSIDKLRWKDSSTFINPAFQYLNEIESDFVGSFERKYSSSRLVNTGGSETKSCWIFLNTFYAAVHKMFHIHRRLDVRCEENNIYSDVYQIFLVSFISIVRFRRKETARESGRIFEFCAIL